MGEFSGREFLLCASLASVGDRFNVIDLLGRHLAKEALAASLASAKFVVTNIDGDPREPSGEGVLNSAVITGERRVSFHESLLHVLLDLRPLSEEPSDGPRDVPFV